MDTSRESPNTFGAREGLLMEERDKADVILALTLPRSRARSRRMFDGTVF